MSVAGIHFSKAPCFGTLFGLLALVASGECVFRSSESLAEVRLACLIVVVSRCMILSACFCTLVNGAVHRSVEAVELMAWAGFEAS